MGKRISDWLETHWVAPAFSGWLIGGLSLFFFMAATNTLAGWLYVISGVSFALLAVAAFLSARSLQDIWVSRCLIHPVSVGDSLMVELVLRNSSPQPKTLLQAYDLLPSVLAKPVFTVVETIAPDSEHHWLYQQSAQRRGVYHWHTVQLRTAAPLGLFWCRRSQNVNATAIVYPTVLPLSHCPLVDQMGQEESLRLQSNRRTQMATEGLTRALRPYRWGDPTRLIHWRTSARYGELRIRELEIFTGGQEILICLDSALSWQHGTIESELASAALEPLDAFEQAVIAAASLYFYAHRQSFQPRLWTAGTGLIHGNQNVLETLASTQAGEEVRAESLPDHPLIWLTQNPTSLNSLPAGSRWLLWPPSPEAQASESQRSPTVLSSPGLVIQPTEPLQLQLQGALSHL
ncbi:MAG: DUF58 domain-containing protein [Scytolyngbya sp. HA4215-MV1]|jgi:uncharacterized protein (DUF58 family)|nr:DUF58 domain-containing protein [Scytolyngbya sp. HA4215-MV1]